MSETREMYDYLLTEELDVIDGFRLGKPLSELACGTFAFGPSEEWQSWYDYLLPRLIPIALQRDRERLDELLVTAVMSQYPNELHKHRDKTYREDVLNTLGRVVMDASKWQDQTPILGRVLHAAPSPRRPDWLWHRPSSDLSASLFLCIKYLSPSEIAPWTRSVFAISDPHWRAQILVWLAASWPLLDGSHRYPSHLDVAAPPVDWEWSHCISGTQAVVDPLGPFIADENIAAFKQAVRDLIRDGLDEWRESCQAIDYLAFGALPVAVELEKIYAAPASLIIRL